MAIHRLVINVKERRDGGLDENVFVDGAIDGIIPQKAMLAHLKKIVPHSEYSATYENVKVHIGTTGASGNRSGTKRIVAALTMEYETMQPVANEKLHWCWKQLHFLLGKYLS